MITPEDVKLPTVYVGYEPREDVAYRVLRESIWSHSGSEINVIPLSEPALRRAGLYRRSYYTEVGNPTQKYDQFDRRPFSTEFSFSRFLVPALNQYSGLALFMDCDMYLRTDINKLFNEYKNMTHAVSVVKHNYKPTNSIKMDGQKQEVYNRKNWSSFVLWNCSHPSNMNLTVDDANTKSGAWLHGFSWLDDDEIGSLDGRWNWLDGHSTEEDPYNVHFTTGGPFFADWKPSRGFTYNEDKYVQEWLAYREALTIKDSTNDM